MNWPPRTPRETKAADVALALINAAPPLHDVLLWHQARCTICGPEWPLSCPEFGEILEEYSLPALLEAGP